MAISLRPYVARVPLAPRLRRTGRVLRVVGVVIEADGPAEAIGCLCHIARAGRPPLPAEVVGFSREATFLMPLGDTQGLEPGALVTSTGAPLRIVVDRSMRGRVLDGLGMPMDGQPPIQGRRVSVEGTPPAALSRPLIREPIDTGVRAIDGLLALGRGQRVGIFAGSGVGKSTLLGMIASHSSADVNVIVLVGERGREVAEFIQGSLGPQGLARSVVVVATSDQPALVRARAPFVGSAIAEFFRDQGMHVALIMDSVTRFAMARREVGLAVGEPPATRGYTPSVFALLPQLLERAGSSPEGTITGLYTVLVEGDDMMEPIADAVRSILDGHIVLSRKLAAEGTFPAIDVLESVSRLMPSVVTREHLAAANTVRDLLAAYHENKDLIHIGAYAPGSSERVDRAWACREPMLAFLRQEVAETSSRSETLRRLLQLAAAPTLRLPAPPPPAGKGA